ncbi:LOW QUALITY PROTEIN: dnaJ homolog subfamily C member 10-like [Pollicipes pollicipes]|uniref:LOW QUALITY PROTEIN: dnaJ homolog subfamily C member 10-like n=1 Tax=Pollicipes pollicipes TaxID=41117 RepID=UPI0018851FC7|nr:LOW QUALITY PROTEIN: dnaJ homolog subfamily C member 10-like [Pollicipes pollicipes]
MTRWISVILLSSVLLISQCSEDFYKLLNISKDATSRELRKAFKKAALETHPDKNQDDPDAHDKFVLINRAYETLKDPDLRKRYDLYGEEGADSGGGGRAQYQSWSYYHDNFGIYDDDPEIVTLDRAEFEQAVRQSADTWFINFYSPGCGHCHDLAPVWRRVARELENVVRVGAVNCAEEWSLCRQENIFSYPSLVLYPDGEDYEGERNVEHLVHHVLRRLHAAPIDVDAENVRHLTKRSGVLAKRPWLIFFCGGGDHSCADDDTKVKVAAIMEGVVNVGQTDCRETALCSSLAQQEYVVYYGAAAVAADRGHVIRSLDAQEIAAETLRLLPPLPTLTEEEYQTMRSELASPAAASLPWLVQFTSDLTPTLELVRLPALLALTSFSRLDCGALPHSLRELHVRKQPAFVLFKPARGGGAEGGYEAFHGRPMAHEVAAFAREAAAAGLRALTPDEFPAALRDGRPRVVDFFAPWCPPCMRLMPELRRASTLRPDVPFGSVDCTVHAELCSRYNIDSYPTVILYNGSEPHQYRGRHTADGLLAFVKDTLNPAAVRLDDEASLERARRRPTGQLWLIDFYAGWCQPCRQFAPEYRRAARLLQPLTDVVVAMVDCAAHQAFCREQGIKSYPTVRLYEPKTAGLEHYSVFSGAREAETLRDWAVGFLPDTVHELTEAEFLPRVLDGDGPWLIDFYTPWCGHCHAFAPVFQLVAQFLEGEVRCGRLDCQRFPRTCRDAGVSAYPTVRLYPGRGRLDMVGTHVRSQEPEDIVTFVRQRLADDRRPRDEL